MRPPRLETLYGSYAGHPVYFVTCATANRKPLLANEIAHRGFLVGCDKAQRAGNAVGRYLLMPDHVHFFISMGPEGRLDLAVRGLRSAVTRALRAAGVSGPIWQEGFFDHLLRHSDSYSEKWAYVVMNPVRAGLVRRPEDWPYQGEVTVLRW